MRFWRGKKEAAKEAVQKIETSEGLDIAASAASADVPDKASSSDSEASTSNVVAITSSSKLSERLAAAGLKPVSAEATTTGGTLIQPLDKNEFPGQRRAYDALQRALESKRAPAHILVTGQAGTGRHAMVSHVLGEACKTLPRPDDWVYLAEQGRKLVAYSLPHGQGAMLAREVEAAVSKFGATLGRLQASDDYRLAMDVIEEEFRHRNDKAFDDLKRRAESQNIALVKTSESFVLVPMHEGKAVRPDVFRALPESLQRDVEAKISALEGELKSYVEGLTAAHASQGDRLQNLDRETAARAAGPQIEAIRRAFGDTHDLLSAVEAALVRTRSAASVLPLQTAGDFSEAAPVIYALDVSANSLLGETGYDSQGRVVLRPGELSRANGGFLIVDAWRLAADPRAWSALSAAIESKKIRPVTAPGALAEAEPVPLSARVVLIGEPQTIAKLQDLDPNFSKYFAHQIRFEASAPASDVGMETFAKLAARVAEDNGLLPLNASCSEALYRDACKRAGKSDSVSLDLMNLSCLLLEADRIASAAGSDAVKRAEIDEALSELQRTLLT